MFVSDFAITVLTDRSYVNFISGYLSTGLSNMGVSFDYQQGLSTILSQFPVFTQRWSSRFFQIVRTIYFFLVSQTEEEMSAQNCGKKIMDGSSDFQVVRLASIFLSLLFFCLQCTHVPVTAVKIFRFYSEWKYLILQRFSALILQWFSALISDFHSTGHLLV